MIRVLMDNGSSDVKAKLADVIQQYCQTEDPEALLRSIKTAGIIWTTPSEDPSLTVRGMPGWKRLDPETNRGYQSAWLQLTRILVEYLGVERDAATIDYAERFLTSKRRAESPPVSLRTDSPLHSPQRVDV